MSAFGSVLVGGLKGGEKEHRNPCGGSSRKQDVPISHEKDTVNRHKTRENAREELAEFKARLNRAKEAPCRRKRPRGDSFRGAWFLELVVDLEGKQPEQHIVKFSSFKWL